MRVKAAVLLAVCVAFSGCSQSSGISVGAQNTVYALKASYAAALTAAVAYAERPRCGKPTSPITCSDQAVIDQMRKADEAASESIGAAEDAVRSLAADPSTVQLAITGAQGALKAYQAIVATYGKK